MELKMTSIYPLMEIQEIYGYDGPFDGIEYDSEDKIKVAREMARWFAEFKPNNHWDGCYPTNREMTEIYKMINSLMKEKKIIHVYPDERFRFASIIDYLMFTKDHLGIAGYEEILKKKKTIRRIIYDILKE